MKRIRGPLNRPDPTQLPWSLPDVKRPAFKLCERRQGSRPKLTIIKPNWHLQPTDLSLPARLEIISSSLPMSSFSLRPSIYPSSSFTNLYISEERTGSTELNREAESRAIKEQRFYFPPSPGSEHENSELELLHLFPITSPKPCGSCGHEFFL
uniref:VQ motif-containing protein 31-like n=1 Tax=Elaeis guineensis var. tenera TaxID=51953 RepID=A0A6J0PEQ7_ELAGV|nr:VQ motif-containing protein 31-like [Elaeis guineensis]